MSLPEKKDAKPDAATLALWRAAESGDVTELAAVLPHVRDINARNEHGVTALMRAAQHGHVRVVRMLLERGADANLKRNDKFTALALAAFFGHTEVVRTLMEHGADSQAKTRYGTSPHMWATARTFNEVVNQLETPAPTPPLKPAAKTPERVQKAPAAVPTAPAAAPTVVRTLKEPPEIWDLVHEAPRGFDARAAFLARLQSVKTGVAFRLVAAAVLIAACAVGVLVLRGVQARSERSADAPLKTPAAKTSVPSVTTKIDPASAPAAELAPTVAPAPATAQVVNDSVKPVVTSNSERRPTRFSSHRVEREQRRVAAVNEAVQPIVAPVEKPNVRVSSEPPTKTKTSSSLSPQLIAPVKSSAPKAKVIQWP
jgi:hypothetical protein